MIWPKLRLALILFICTSSCYGEPPRPVEQLLQAPYQVSADERRLAAKRHAEFNGQFDYINPELKQLVQTTAAALIQQLPAPANQLQLNVIYLDWLHPNAFAIVDGSVFITTGIIIALEDNQQLAALLAHEIAHIFARHYIDNYRDDDLASDLNYFSRASHIDDRDERNAYIELLKLQDQAKLSQTQEWEADTLALWLLARAGYDTRAQTQMLKILMRYEEAIEPLSQTTDGHSYNSHPATSQRIRLSKKLAKKYQRHYGTEQKIPRQSLEPLKLNHPIAMKRSTISYSDKLIAFNKGKLALTLPAESKVERAYVAKIHAQTQGKKFQAHYLKQATIDRLRQQLRSNYFRYHWSENNLQQLSGKSSRTVLRSKLDDSALYLNYRSTDQGGILVSYTDKRLAPAMRSMLEFKVDQNALTKLVTLNLKSINSENISEQQITTLEENFPQYYGHTLELINSTRSENPLYIIEAL